MRTGHRYFASTALALSVFIGLVLPISDAAPSVAVAVEDDTISGNSGEIAAVPETVSPETSNPGTDGTPSPAPLPGGLAEAPPAGPASADEAPSEETEPQETQVSRAAPAAPGTAARSMALGDGCSFANPGTGSHAQSLCWLDLNGFTTAYTEVSRVTTRNGTATRPYSFTTTITSESALGAAYGTVTVTGTATSNNQTTAQNNSVNAAVNNLGAQLHLASGIYYGQIANYPLSIPLSESYVLTANLSVNSAAGGRGLAAEAVGFPTWAGSFLGNNSFYTGVDGKPALYQTSDGGSNAAQNTTTATLGDIRVADGAGQRVADFAIVVADAESTDTNESITWTHQNGAGFKWLPNNPASYLAASTDAARKTATVGNACNATPASQFPSGNTVAATRACTAGTSGQASPKSGTAMLQIAPLNATANFQVSQAMLGGGKQAVAFGVILAGAQVTVNVDDRILNASGTPSTAEFTASLIRVGGSTSTAATGSVAKTATTGPEFVPVGPLNGSQMSFQTSVSGPTASSYRVGWVCARTQPNSSVTIRWPASGSSPTPPTGTNARVVGGEFLDCTVTYSPPYLTLVKSVDNASTGATNTAANFTLTATGPSSLAQGPGSPAVKRAVAIDSYALSETGPVGTGAWEFGYDWTNLVCTANAGSSARGAFTPSTDPGSGVTTGGTLQVLAGNDVTCTYSNRANAPELTLKKESSPASGTSLNPAQTVTYTLTFDNSAGTAAIAVNHVDHLKDVLDDASFVAGSIRYGNGTVPPTATNPLTPGVTALPPNASQQVALTGTVPARSIRTVSFAVKVLANETNTADRQSANAPLRGYTLQNFLTKLADPVPQSCDSPAPGQQVTCTASPVRSWTIAKNSQPEDGAMIHVGGNIYYRVKVTNFSGENVTGVTLTDDLTQTLSATVWDPTAPAAVPVPYGISYYGGAGGNSLLQSNPWNAVTGPKPVFTGDSSFDPAFPDGNPFPGGSWTFETPAFDIPAQIAGQPVSYAIVGYAVQGGYVADPANPSQKYASAVGLTKALPNAVWVNTAQAGRASVGGQLLYPNRCSLAAPGIAPGDTGENYDCKTWHTLGDSYFHLWKKSGDAATGQSNNLAGSTFVIADTEADARNAVSSRWLCRVENAVPNPNDVFSEPSAPAGSTTSGIADFGVGSQAHASIQTANLARALYNAQQTLVPGDSGFRPQLAQCGLFFQLDTASEGQAAGSWRAMDIRGGDTVSGGAASLPNWRGASAFNNGMNDSAGRHGTYWLAETVSPANHQLLAQPMKLWVAPDAPTPEGQSLAPGSPRWYDYQGRLSLPVVGVGEIALPGQGMAGGSEIRRQCVSPYELPAASQPACAMPTGWTMPIFDVKLQPLPLTGGAWSTSISFGGAGILLAALAGSWWWRRRHAGTLIAPGGAS